jgi:hypothetical protein
VVLILIVIGVPLWFGALSLLILVRKNRNIRQRPGNVPIRVRAAGKKHWMPAHGLWVHDVFAFRGSPAAWNEGLLWVKEASARPPSPEERKKLHRLGDAPLIATFTGRDGDGLELATRREHRDNLLGPFAEQAVIGGQPNTRLRMSPPDAAISPSS